MALPTADEAVQFLADLGLSRAEIADAIRARGIRETGDHVNITRNCAVALLLRHEYPDLNTRANWQVGSWNLTIGQDRVALPTPVSELINVIDQERYELLHPSNPGKHITYRDLLPE
jgi:hypothetical protein